ncbi:hypothetical protein TPHA_0K01690 [Tetrapisispora phaffii CBS 4417]|uniref:Uncharacterized protein n=1 Tax=Tetrapisispora phaffii (strain ATCC 24235 / CBS 4417 / NBRC 1672 / NRRL Y-8282 / UCD 70-5) TaxID=1071381 RepID=G8BZH4_TETPH|nr:hypothetical protein TPHA_0K01690 [Tetrapisispora phaffii CBS 4417]CCE65302.1 hypothetical protein TPHA_0K01690 [Tetrapisispora phaffii CBS 4417]
MDYVANKSDLSVIVARRREKFSKGARDRILNDSLNDTALLSRSSQNGTAGITALQRDQSKRVQFFKSLKDEYDQDAINDPKGFELKLRKLREIIVSVYDENRRDSQFLQLAEDAYILSYKFMVEHHNNSASLVSILEFMINNNLKCSKKFLPTYIIYITHSLKNLETALQLNYKYYYETDSLLYYTLLRSSLIYVQSTESPSEWFKILADIKIAIVGADELSQENILFQYLINSEHMEVMKLKTLSHLSKCFNQLPLAYAVDQLFCNFIDKSYLIRKGYKVDTTKSGTVMIIFKDRSNNKPSS